MWDAYEKDIKEAKTSDDKQMLESGQYHECREFDDELLSMDSTEICRRARLCHLSITDFPLPPGETSYWVTGNYGAQYIDPKTLREFTKAVETAEYERAKRNVELRDFWLKIFTAVSIRVTHTVGDWPRSGVGVRGTITSRLGETGVLDTEGTDKNKVSTGLSPE